MKSPELDSILSSKKVSWFSLLAYVIECCIIQGGSSQLCMCVSFCLVTLIECSKFDCRDVAINGHTHKKNYSWNNVCLT